MQTTDDKLLAILSEILAALECHKLDEDHRHAHLAKARTMVDEMVKARADQPEWARTMDLMRGR